MRFGTDHLCKNPQAIKNLARLEYVPCERRLKTLILCIRGDGKEEQWDEKKKKKRISLELVELLSRCRKVQSQ